ncbi:hypothetical protein MTP03_00060 [Tsukamurella sp. PLM1]|nr:hypothetical protein MTP03_00060 [Tsukamurella sp. PLM1]
MRGEPLRRLVPEPEVQVVAVRPHQAHAAVDLPLPRGGQPVEHRLLELGHRGRGGVTVESSSRALEYPTVAARECGASPAYATVRCGASAATTSSRAASTSAPKCASCASHTSSVASIDSASAPPRRAAP